MIAIVRHCIRRSGRGEVERLAIAQRQIFLNGSLQWARGGSLLRRLVGGISSIRIRDLETLLEYLEQGLRIGWSGNRQGTGIVQELIVRKIRQAADESRFEDPLCFGEGNYARSGRIHCRQ